MTSKIILVTGANRGIGYSIVQGLSKRAPENTYLLGVRAQSSGEEAAKQLRELQPSSDFQPLELDVTDDDSIRSAIKTVESKYGRLDVLVNNAAWAKRPQEDYSDFREIYTQMFDTNVTAPILLSSLFIPLLKKSPDPRVIMVSSVRGSFSRAFSGAHPPAFIAYSASKSALNMATGHLGLQNPGVLFQAACPGFCKTAFNGFKGPKDPLDGARVVVELATAPREQFPASFYEYEVPGGVQAVEY